MCPGLAADSGTGGKAVGLGHENPRLGAHHKGSQKVHILAGHRGGMGSTEGD